MCLDLRARCLTTVGRGLQSWARRDGLSPSSFSCPSAVSQMDISECKCSEGVLDFTFRWVQSPEPYLQVSWWRCLIQFLPSVSQGTLMHFWVSLPGSQVPVIDQIISYLRSSGFELCTSALQLCPSLPPSAAPHNNSNRNSSEKVWLGHCFNFICL